MRKIIIPIVFFLYSLCSYSTHKDQFFADQFGNVKTLTRTGFYGYGITEKVRIAGQLVEKLCLKLSYRDTIVIEFSHDYANFYNKIIIVENGNPESTYLINNDIELIEYEQIKSHQKIKAKRAICIRILDSEFDIAKVLKIAEHCILNKFDNKTIKLHCKSSHYFATNEMIHINYLGMPNELITKIIETDNSEILKEVNNESVIFFTHDGVNGTYQNGTYHFTNSKINYQTNDLMYLTILNYGICVFETNKSFVYLTKNSEEIKKFEADIAGNYSYITSHLTLLEGNINRLQNNNIMLYKFNQNKGIIFSEEKNEIVRIVNK